MSQHSVLIVTKKSLGLYGAFNGADI